jgi:hypothetical protein
MLVKDDCLFRPPVQKNFLVPNGINGMNLLSGVQPELCGKKIQHIVFPVNEE